MPGTSDSVQASQLTKYCLHPSSPCFISCSPMSLFLWFSIPASSNKAMVRNAVQTGPAFKQECSLQSRASAFANA